MAGFPNAAEEAGDEPLNLHKLVVKSPASTFFMRVEGDMGREIGVHAGDLLVIDRGLEISSGDTVVAAIEGEFVARVYINRGGMRYLTTGGRRPKQIPLDSDKTIELWGVVSHVVHPTRGRGLT